MTDGMAEKCEPADGKDRSTRLKAALRANLAKRKERDRARTAGEGESLPPPD